MKTRQILTLLMLLWAGTAYSQLNFLHFTSENGEGYEAFAIDRTLKKAWAFSGDEAEPYTMTKYKKNGNTETLTLKQDDTVIEERDGSKQVYPGMYIIDFTLTLDPKTQLAVKGKMVTKTVYNGSVVETKTCSYNVKNLTCETESPEIVRWIKEEAGYSKPDANAKSVTSPSRAKAKDEPTGNDEATAGTPENPVDKVKNTAKKTFGKVKGLLKKK